MKKQLGIVLALLFLLPILAVAQEAGSDLAVPNKTATPEQKAVMEKIMGIVGFLQYIAAGIAALATVIVGIMFMQASEPAEKKRLGDRLKMIIIGLVLVLLSIPLVKLIIQV